MKSAGPSYKISISFLDVRLLMAMKIWFAGICIKTHLTMTYPQIYPVGELLILIQKYPEKRTINLLSHT